MIIESKRIGERNQDESKMQSAKGGTMTSNPIKRRKTNNNLMIEWRRRAADERSGWSGAASATVQARHREGALRIDNGTQWNQYTKKEAN